MAKVIRVSGDKSIIAKFKYKPEDGKRSIHQDIIVEVKPGSITLSLPDLSGLINISPSIENNNKLCLVACPVGGEGSRAAYCEVLTHKKNPPS